VETVVPETDAERFRLLYPALRRLAAVAAPSDLDPDDLLQEAVTRVLARGGLADLDHPLAYLRRTIVHVASNHNRSRGRERRALDRVAGADRASAGGREAVYPSDLAELDLLDPVDRTAVYLADVERLPVAEVAEAIGASTVATRARLSRARRRVRAAIEAMEATGASGPAAGSRPTGGGDR
jgi:RNA polymerase sigma-70 factor (ECF subfamily)